MSLRSEGRVIFCGHRKARASALMLAAAHENQLGHHAIDGLVIAQRVVKEKSERSGAALRLIQQGRILGKQVEPFADEVIGAPFVAQQPTNHFCTLVRIGIREESRRFRVGWLNTERVEPDASEKGSIRNQVRLCHLFGRDRSGRPFGPGLDPIPQSFDLVRAQPFVSRRHTVVLIIGDDSCNQLTRLRVAGHNRFQGTLPGIQPKIAFVFFPMTTKTVLTENRQHLVMKLRGRGSVSPGTSGERAVDFRL